MMVAHSGIVLRSLVKKTSESLEPGSFRRVDHKVDGSTNVDVENIIYMERTARGGVNGLGTVLSFHVQMVVVVVMVASNDKKTKKTRPASRFVFYHSL